MFDYVMRIVLGKGFMLYEFKNMMILVEVRFCVDVF